MEVGWHVRLYPLSGDPPMTLVTTEGGRSRKYARKCAEIYRASFVNDGLAEIVIEPVRGWENVNNDPLTAIVYAVAEGDVPPDLAVKQIRRLMEVYGGSTSGDQGGIRG